MDTDDIRNARAGMRDAFAECVSAYGNLRGYIADRYNDRNPDLLAWLKEKRIMWVETPESEAWEATFWNSWHDLHDALDAYDAEGDEITEAVYEDALAREEPWAVEAYEYRQRDR